MKQRDIDRKVRKMVRDAKKEMPKKRSGTKLEHELEEINRQKDRRGPVDWRKIK